METKLWLVRRRAGNIPDRREAWLGIDPAHLLRDTFQLRSLSMVIDLYTFPGPKRAVGAGCE